MSDCFSGYLSSFDCNSFSHLANFGSPCLSLFLGYLLNCNDLQNFLRESLILLYLWLVVRCSTGARFWFPGDSFLMWFLGLIGYAANAFFRTVSGSIGSLRASHFSQYFVWFSSGYWMYPLMNGDIHKLCWIYLITASCYESSSIGKNGLNRNLNSARNLLSFHTTVKLKVCSLDHNRYLFFLFWVLTISESYGPGGHGLIVKQS